MKRIAITGGIGAGKTAVTGRLQELGYDVVDADVIARSVTDKGTPAWQALCDAFGRAVLDDRGEIDRAFLAEVVFNDPTALRRLNHITHGRIGVEMVRQLDAASGEAAFVALPLFRPEHRDALTLDEVWSVQVEPETAVRRLCEGRGFTEADAWARIANQMTNDERASIVDRVIWNEEGLAELYGHVDAALVASGVANG